MTGSLHVVDEYALSPMQQGMLSQTLDAPAGGVYSIVVSYRLHGPLDPARFAEAWRRVIAHQANSENNSARRHPDQAVS